MFKFKKGMLVQVKTMIEAAYSGYAGRPLLYLKPHMLGVVRITDPNLGAQVEYIDPQSGCVEHAWVTYSNLNLMTWPDNCVDLSKVVPEDGAQSDYWFCGSISFLGVVQYIKAIAYYSYDYLQEIEVTTIRVPGVHATRLRSFEPIPEVYMPERKTVLDSELTQVLEIA